MWQLILTSVKESAKLHVYHHKAAWKIKRNGFAYASSQPEECQTQELHQCIQVKPVQVKHFCRNDTALVHH